MADFNIRSESVDVEQIMKQIRARIREKRGVDYTEEQIRELASVRLETFLDPKNLRSDLLDQFRRSRPAVAPEPPPVEAPYEFTDQTLFETHRGALRFVRRLLNPILKLFFNPNPLINVLHTQAQFNVDLLKREQRRKIEFDRSRAEWNALYYEVLHNLVLETTRSGIEIKNLKMRLEALASRLDFSERRVRALEGVVQYRPEIVRRIDRAEREARASAGTEAEDVSAAPETERAATLPAGPTAEASRRRRRRRRGRRGASASAGTPQPAGESVEGDVADESESFDAAEDAREDADVEERRFDERASSRHEHTTLTEEAGAVTLHQAAATAGAEQPRAGHEHADAGEDDLRAADEQRAPAAVRPSAASPPQADVLESPEAGVSPSGSDPAPEPRDDHQQ